MKNETVDIETIDILLIGDEKEIADAIKLIHTHFRYKIIEIIRTVALSATRDDLFDIYQEVLLAIFEKARKNNYDPDKNRLLPLIRTIAINKAKDWVRKKYAKKRGTDASEDEDDIVDAVAEAIKDSQIDEPWQYAQRKDQRSAILKTLRSLIIKLKPRQRQVAEVLIVKFLNIFDLADFQEEILTRYNENVTIQSVRRAREEVLSKVREALSITGYGNDIDE
jgi:DNA-directed RNA polymerase specialized sigma24 family protein